MRTRACDEAEQPEAGVQLTCRDARYSSRSSSSVVPTRRLSISDIAAGRSDASHRIASQRKVVAKCLRLASDTSGTVPRRAAGGRGAAGCVQHATMQLTTIQLATLQAAEARRCVRFCIIAAAVRQASDSRIEVLRSADLLPPAGLRDFGADAERPAIAGRAYSRAHTDHTDYSAEPTLSTQPSPH
jgi:hypothetical protein